MDLSKSQRWVKGKIDNGEEGVHFSIGQVPEWGGSGG